MIGRIAMGAALLIAGCSQPDEDAVNGDRPNAAISADGAAENMTGNLATADNVSAPVAPDASGNVSLFTSNDPKKCRIVEKNEEEGGYFRYRCPGAGGFNYELVESDLRQSLVILAPGGRRDDVALSAVAGGGGFSTIGPTFDWRGPAGQPPRTVTVRFNVNESPDPNVPARSYLVVIKLAAAACPVQAIPPGPEQSARAREFADRAKLPPCVGG